VSVYKGHEPWRKLPNISMAATTKWDNVSADFDVAGTVANSGRDYHTLRDESAALSAFSIDGHPCAGAYG
jgi:hypothetical protein